MRVEGAPYRPGRAPYLVATSCALQTPFSYTLRILVGKNSLYNLPEPGPGANSDAYHFGPSTNDEMEADLKMIDSMEEDQEVTSRFQAGFMMGELQSSAIPNSVIPSNVRLPIINNSTFSTSKGDIITWVWALPLETSKLGGGAPVSYHHHTPIFTIFLSSILLAIS